MKSMVKILVTIMALSLAEAPVFAAWPAEGMKVTQKVVYLKATYPGAVIAKNPTHDYLNALEAQLSAAPVVPAPVGEVMGMVVVGGAGLDLELGGALTPAPEVGGAPLTPAPEVGDVDLEVVGGGQATNKRMCLPVLGGFGGPWVELSTQRALQIAQGQVAMAEDDEAKAKTRLYSLGAQFKQGGDKPGQDPSRLLNGFLIYTRKAEEATLARRQAVAQLVFSIKQNSLFEYFTPIAGELNTLTARAADLTVAEIDGFIAMIKDIIKEVELKSGAMSAGTKEIYDQFVKPFEDYAGALSLYVEDLEKNKAELIRQAGGLSGIGLSALLASCLTPTSLTTAAALAGALVGWQVGGNVLGTFLYENSNQLPFLLTNELLFAADILNGFTAAGGGALVGGSVASLATGGAAVGKDSSSAGAKRKHGGDDKV